MQFELEPIAPFNFCEILRRPASRQSRLISVDLEQQSIARVLRIEGQAVPVVVTAIGDVERPRLRVEAEVPAHTAWQEAIAQCICHIFGINVDLTPIYQHFSDIPPLDSLMKRFRGLRLLLDADPFESLVKIIIGQQLNLTFAAALVDRLVELKGTRREWKGRTLYAFPTATELADTPVDALLQRQFSRRKAEYILNLAQCVADGRIDLEQLQSQPDEVVFEALTALRGIGRWSVECLLLFAYGRPDFCPAGDIGVRNGVRFVFGLDEQPSENAVRRLATAWAPWRSYATYYLWQSLIGRGGSP